MFSPRPCRLVWRTDRGCTLYTLYVEIKLVIELVPKPIQSRYFSKSKAPMSSNLRSMKPIHPRIRIDRPQHIRRHVITPRTPTRSIDHSGVNVPHLHVLEVLTVCSHGLIGGRIGQDEAARNPWRGLGTAEDVPRALWGAMAARVLEDVLAREAHGGW
jgi:hypothetical protein